MRRVLLYIPVVLSLVLLGAHFLRFGHMPGVGTALALIALLFVRRRWVARLIQAALVLGALEWARTLYELAAMRAAHGQAYTRMTVILAAVAALTLLSALVFQSRSMKGIYRRGARAELDSDA